MACPTYLQDLSLAIWLDLGSPTDLSPAAIQTKLSSAAFLGKLNALTANCYVLESDGTITPPLGLEEQAIYALMYEVDYYTGKLNNVLNGYNTAFTTIRDGDSSITRSSAVDVARLYRDQQKQLMTELSGLIGSYRTDAAGPLSVDMYNVTYGGADGAYSGPMGSRSYYRS